MTVTSYAVSFATVMLSTLSFTAT